MLRSLEAKRKDFWNARERGDTIEAYLHVEEVWTLRPLAILAIVDTGVLKPEQLQEMLLGAMDPKAFETRDITSLIESVPGELWRNELLLDKLVQLCRHTFGVLDRSLACRARLHIIATKALLWHGKFLKAREVARDLSEEIMNLLDMMHENKKMRTMYEEIACLSGECLVLAGESRTVEAVLEWFTPKKREQLSGNARAGLAQSAFRLAKYSDAKALYQSSLMRSCDRRLRARARWGIGNCGLMQRQYTHHNFCLYGIQKDIRSTKNRLHQRWRKEGGCRVMIHCEQGPGEEVFFFRFVALLIEEYPRTGFVLKPSEKLKGVIKGWFVDLQVVGIDITEEEAEVDFEIAVGMIPYYLNPERLQHRVIERDLRARRSIQRGTVQKVRDKRRYKVGVAWRSSMTDYSLQKSVGIGLLNSVMAIDEIDVVSLQHKLDSNEVQICRENRIEIVDTNADAGDWSALLGALLSLDEIVTCSTAVAHLAAAIGTKTTVLLNRYHSNSWMWNHDEHGKADWYASASICTQRTAGDWQGLVETTAEYVEMRSRIYNSQGDR